MSPALSIAVEILFIILVSSVVSNFLLPHVSLLAVKKRLFDKTDRRKTHSGLVPRLGGLVFFPCICATLVLALLLRHFINGYSLLLDTNAIQPLFSLIALLLLYGVGAADDVFGVRYCYKLAVQLLCGTLIVSSGLYFGNFYGAFGLCELPQWFACPFTVIVLMLLCNAMNFIDGIDGLAAGITIIVCIYMGTVFLIVTNYSFGFMAFAVVGTLLPFFYYNVFGNAKRGRKIFMGDAGSLTLGLMLGILAIKMCQTEQIEQNTGVNPVVAAMSVLIVPVFDLLRVFIFRIVHHKSPFLPDRNHIHHRLMSAGLNQHQALIVLLLTTVLFTGLNILLSRYVSATLIFIADVLVWAAAHGVVAHAIGKARGANS